MKRPNPPQVIGTTDIPKHQTCHDVYREIISDIPEGKATILEFESYEALLDGQRRLHNAALTMFGKRGCNKTKRNGYVTGGLQLLVWVVKPQDAIPAPLPLFQVDVEQPR